MQEESTIQLIAIGTTCVLVLAAVVLFCYVYFFPSIVAYKGQHSLKRVIFWFNGMSIPITAWLADGFTWWFLVPWIITLFWAASE